MKKLSELFDLGLAEKDRCLAMEGMRGFAVILVFFVHYSSQISFTLGLPVPGVGKALQHIGHVGVDLFFILSGYLIYGALIRKPRPFYSYIARRVQRIYPTFLVVLAIYLFLALVSSSGNELPQDTNEKAGVILANFLLLPGVFSITPIVVVAWSLSYEAAFYLTLPLFIGTLHFRAWSSFWRGWLLLSIAVVITLSGWHHSRMVFFVCGMLLVEAMPLLRARRLDWAALSLLPICGSLYLRGDGSFV